MSSDFVAYSLSKHAAPHRERVTLAALLYALLAAPIVWAGDLMVDFALISHSCYPGDIPLAGVDQGFGWVWPVVLAFHLLTIAIIVSAGMVGYRNWQLTGPPRGHSHHLVEVGEGRTRYLGIVAMGFSFLFLLLAVTETVSMAFVPLCTH